MNSLVSKEPIFAIDVCFTDDHLIVLASDGTELSIPLAWFPRLLEATPVQLAKWRFIGKGQGIHWEELDEDIFVETLLN